METPELQRLPPKQKRRNRTYRSKAFREITLRSLLGSEMRNGLGFCVEPDLYRRNPRIVWGVLDAVNLYWRRSALRDGPLGEGS